MKRVLVSFLLLTVTFFQFPTAEGATKDFTIPAKYTLSKCLGDAELDCIESVGLIYSDGKYKDGTLVSEGISTTPKIENGNSLYVGSSTWIAENQSIEMTVTLDTTFFKGCAGTCAALRIRPSVDNPLKTKVRFVIRTSWLRPMNVVMHAFESDYKYEKINGGARLTMEGMGIPVSVYSSRTGEEFTQKLKSQPKADNEMFYFDFDIHHAGMRVTDSYWDPRCSDKGFSVYSHNANATGDPMWDPGSESLIFNIFAPHLKSTGELNFGYFKYWASHEFLDCKFPNNNLTKSSKLKIEIINEDGTTIAATTAIQNKNGELFFSAFGFHYSSPKIVLRAEKPLITALLPTPSPTPSATATKQALAKPKKVVATKKTITCKKGKLTKKVTGLAPKCPSGYKISPVAPVQAATTPAVASTPAPISCIAECTIYEGQSLTITAPRGKLIERMIGWYGNPSDKNQGALVSIELTKLFFDKKTATVTASNALTTDPAFGVTKVLIFSVTYKDE